VLARKYQAVPRAVAHAEAAGELQHAPGGGRGVGFAGQHRELNARALLLHLDGGGPDVQGAPSQELFGGLADHLAGDVVEVDD